MPTPTIFWNANRDGSWQTSARWTPNRLPTSTDDVAIDTADLHTIFHNKGADTVHTLTVGNDNFEVSGGSIAISSTSSFAHLLFVDFGTLTLGGAATAASFTQNSGTVSGAGDLTVTGLASFLDNPVQTGSGTTLLQGASTLSGFANTLGLDGGRVLENQGTFALTGTATLLLGDNLSGTSVGGATLKNDAGATIDIQGSNHIGRTLGDTTFTNAGTVEKTGRAARASIDVALTNTGVVLVQMGQLFFTAALTNSGSGTISISSGAYIGITRAGTFVQGGGAVSGAGTLEVLGAATFTSKVAQTGAGTTLLGGASTLSGRRGLSLDGGRVLENQGTLSLTGTASLLLGDNPFGTTLGGATLANDAGATIDIQGANQILAVAGADSFTNAGVLERTVGTGRAVVGVAVDDSGAIEAASGTLKFTQPISGDGTMVVDSGATLEANASAASTLAMTFNGGGATLALGDAAAFAAIIAGFAPTDTIDLLKTTADSATLGAGDTLVIKNGASTVATLQLGGDYTGDTFHVSSDGLSGTNITVTSGPSRAARFITAIAGFGGDSHGPVSVFREAHDVHPPMLAAPRMAMA